MTNTLRPLLAACVGGLTILTLACAGAPRQRPVPLGEVDTGPGSVEYVRRQLQGEWELLSLTTFDAGGSETERAATGRLTFDEFGNLEIAGQLNEPPPGTTATSGPFLRYSGRVVIDTARQALILQDIEGNIPPSEGLPPELAVSPVRYYTFDGNLLRTSVRDPEDRTTAELTWRRLD